MNYEDMFKIVKELEFDKERIVFTDEAGTQVYLFRPSILPGSLRNKYDVNKNFQIWLREGERKFRPNHLRLMIDLNLRTRSRPDLKKQLLSIFDNIFYGKNPEEECMLLNKEKFEHYLNSLEVIGVLAQLFLIEQEFNYTRESNFSPKTLFLQGWIREFIDSPKEIDNMCMSVCRFQPPKAQYTNKENKKHTKFEENLKPLWYLQHQ